MYSPWIDAGERHGDWTIERVPLRGLHEVMCIRSKVILLERNRTKWERRCDLAHAIAHIDLGHRGDFDRKAERAAVRHAAKMLIDLEPLGDVLASTGGRVTFDGAHALGVDVETMTARLQHLHASERAYLVRRTAHLREEHVA
ncbi:MAG: putative Zn peptidase [Frankiales bacterium]|nr:putative Zn peptidase [Frankiales bacterium]